MGYLLYNIGITTLDIFFFILACFSAKVKKMRFQMYKDKDLLSKIYEKFRDLEVVWFHAASLGEFYQGRSIIEKIKKHSPSTIVVQTFFSPSGYENIDDPLIDYKFYLPLDTKKKARNFIKKVNPKLVIFIKYEFWPNYILELHRQAIPLLFVSAVFRESHIIFKPYGRWLLHLVRFSQHIFTQDYKSLEMLKKNNIRQTSLSGDTRFDSVWELAQRGVQVSKIKNFLTEHYLFIAGSSWREDEDFLIPYIEISLKSSKNWKFLIAPHDVSEQNVAQLHAKISHAVRYSKFSGTVTPSARVMILDTIGVLRYAYTYAHIAYVGGGFSHRGLHNILEPASFGVPVFFGPKHKKFWEAEALVEYGGGDVLYHIEDFKHKLQQLMLDDVKRGGMSQKAYQFIEKGRGAAEVVWSYISENGLLS